ncbi:hypothetical protein PoB_007280500 [Plakobranchus ocellatus]|uniref:Uncharacterized protein n=1 Tax=Plakobranchus ocellatus TaxID=259542 RepID=A0AAV4DQ83_9GAST|nr:hypothetical protein PoB_007280500 [Plakobranchus ocellatus]
MSGGASGTAVSDLVLESTGTFLSQRSIRAHLSSLLHHGEYFPFIYRTLIENSEMKLIAQIAPETEIRISARRQYCLDLFLPPLPSLFQPSSAHKLPQCRQSLPTAHSSQLTAHCSDANEDRSDSHVRQIIMELFVHAGAIESRSLPAKQGEWFCFNLPHRSYY